MRCSNPKDGIIGTKALEVLEVIFKLYKRGPVTFRAIMAEMGFMGTNAVTTHVVTLEKHGLVEQDCVDRRRGGTLRPTCRFIPADQIGGEHGPDCS